MVQVNVVNNSTSLETHGSWLSHLVIFCNNESPYRLPGLLFIAAFIASCLKIRQINANSPIFSATLSFILTLIIGPFLIITLVVFSIYRCIVGLYLRRRLGRGFSGLLKGPDVIWAMELPEARSIITVLVLLRISAADVVSSRGCYGKQLLQTVRHVTEKSLMNPIGMFPKLMQLRRKSSLGYHFWIKPDNLIVDNFVRFLDIRESAVDGLSDHDLRQIIGECCNKPMPYEDTATWEVLVGQQHLMETVKTDKLFPVVFRIHHTVGDGVALLRLLIEGVADRVSKSSVATNSKEVVSPHRRNDEDSGYENDSHESLYKDSIPKEDPAPRLPSPNSHTNFKTKLKSKFGSFRAAITPEKNSIGRPKFEGVQRLLAKKMSSVRKWRRNTLSGVPILLEFSKQDEEFLAMPKPIDNLDAVNVEYEENVQPVSFEETPATVENTKPAYVGLTASDIPVITPRPNASNCTIPSCRDIGILVMISIIVTLTTIVKGFQAFLQLTWPSLVRAFKFTVMTPHVIFSQVFGSTEDQFLYGKPLCGEKVVAWITESDAHLKSKIRRMRLKLGVKFTHVLFACLSRSLQKFYQQHGATTPSTINVVLPARVDIADLSKGLQTTATFKAGVLRGRVTRLYGARRAIARSFQPDNLSFSSSAESDQEEVQQKFDRLHRDLSNVKTLRRVELDNKFTVAMLRLPVSEVSFPDLVDLVRNEYNRLRKAPDYLANYWLLRWVAQLAPSPFLKPFLAGAPCSLVLSNLPGPEDVIHLAKKPIHDIVFWVPNRGLNGVGIGILSYCQRFSIGIVADKALIPDPDTAHQIIAGIFDEVNSLVDIFGNHSAG